MVGGSIKYVYDKLGRVLSVTKPNNTKDSYTYDGIGNITKVGYSDNNGSEKSKASVQYDYSNNIIRFTNENNNVEIYDYDPVGNPVSVTKGGSVLSTYTYDTRLRPATLTEGKSVTTYSYDNRDRLTSEIVKEGTKVLSNKTYAYENNSTGLKTTEKINGDANSATVTNITQADILGRNTMVNEAGKITYYTYDMLDNLIKSQNYIAKLSDRTVYLTMDYTYDHNGNVLSTTRTDGNGTTDIKKTYATYDMLGRMITSTDGKGNTTEYTYNALNLVTNKKVPFAVDNNGNMQYTNYTYTYDKVGNLTAEDVTSGVRNSYKYDYRNRVTEAKSGSQTVNYVYDDVGNTISYNTAGGTQTHQYEYDGLNRVIKYTDALGKSETYTYDSNQDMTKKVDRNGKTVSYTYDGLHRMLTEKADGVNNSWTYGLTGGILTESNANATKTYTYNNKGLVANESTKIGSDTFKISRFYDTRGNDRQDDYYKNGKIYQKYKYVYDNKNRLNSLYDVDISSGEETRKVIYYYDFNDNVTSAHYGNNTYQVYYYNAANLVTCMDMVRKSDNTKLEHIVQRYRLDGNISGKTETYGYHTMDTAYTYDDTGRLTKEAVTGDNNEFSLSYSYDNAGNRTSVTGAVNRTYSYDSNNRLLSETSQYSSTNYTYDNNGNQIKKEAYRLNSDGTKTVSKIENFVYNGLNQLIDYSASDDRSASYKYMANGYRLSRTVSYKNILGGIKTEETRYLWDKDNIVSFMDSSNNVTKKHYRGYQLICDDADKYYMHDPHGNVIETYKSGETTPFDRYYYNAFGTQDGFDDTDMIERSNEWGYCDQLYDNYTWDYYMRARYYNPSIGRFITEDPIRDGSNWYSYCGGNPVMFCDILGLSGKGVQLRKWVEDRTKELSYVTSSISWNQETSTATVTMNNDTISVTRSFTNGVNGTYIENGKMYASTDELMKTFGLVIDPPLEVHPNRDAFVIATTIVFALKGVPIIINLSKKVAPEISNEVIQAKRVGSALKLDKYHAFNDIIDNYAGAAIKTNISNGGVLYQLEGSLNGVKGRFEWIIQGGNVTHRMFIPKGVVNGVPIKP